jgi:predicted Zn-dependent protease with MMP-like domain
MSARSISYRHILFYSLFMFSIAVVTSYLFSITVIAEREQENMDIGAGNADEDFEAQNTIQICCTWGHNLLDGILTYYVETGSSTKQHQDEVTNAVQEWDRNLDSLELEESSSKKKGDILIEFQKEYERNEREKMAVGQSINTLDNSGFIDKVEIIVYRGTSEYEFDEDIIQRIVEHEIGHALGLGHANFDGNLMAEKVNDGTENISECEIKAVLKANYWKLIAESTNPIMPEKNEVVCTE